MSASDETIALPRLTDAQAVRIGALLGLVTDAGEVDQ